MSEIELLATGEGDYRLHDPDAIRAWMYVYSVDTDDDMLERRVGLRRLKALRRRATIREGYGP